ncbi:hypothetical protein GOBAR_AA33547 [Gossypium barbadense]|uniref:Uncharacterized protein n=1 Tax=Gossypium barbadense TaxID=3634 RepID=A0A2P5W7R2_GOSBA|nr:hypothetical protein GOBAR_AA33547 [Gossypium barbadense]
MESIRSHKDSQWIKKEHGENGSTMMRWVRVEKVFGASHPDSIEIEKAKEVLKEHEQALVDAIARLEGASDGESDGEHPFSQGQSMDQERAWRKRQYNDEMGEGRIIEGSDGAIK